MEKTIKKRILFGAEAVGRYCDMYLEDEVPLEYIFQSLDEDEIPYEILEREFTEKEWKAYTQALRDMCGWEDFYIIKNGER